ncbi:molecular chaperone [Vibrio maerlii]|uniref:fimbrial biogenesis chaperone n=1 Tax=Vibrio maerlii TaxID=2231648 RepID=UPI0013DED4BC|nr:fimbria/pilus periplasmic chaperone [Vibrio maerlii]
MKYLVSTLLLLWSSLASSFQVEPMFQHLSNVGSRAQAEYRVENTGTEPLAIESAAYSREVISDIDEDLVPADHDFIIMPPQAIIEPGEYQLFRVRYLGSDKLNESISYRVTFKQLPLKNEIDGTGVDLLFNFATLVFVSPENASSKLEASLNDEAISITNLGNGVANLNNSSLTLTSTDDKQILSWNDYSAISPASYLLPSQTIIIPTQEEWINGKSIIDVDVSILQ